MSISIGTKVNATYKHSEAVAPIFNAEVVATEWNEEETPIVKLGATQFVALDDKWEIEVVS